MAKEEKTLDEMFQELDKLIQAMEEPEVSLEDSFQMYHQGIDMLKACNDKMDKIEKQMLVLDSEGETHELKYKKSRKSGRLKILCRITCQSKRDTRKLLWKLWDIVFWPEERDFVRC